MKRTSSKYRMVTLNRTVVQAIRDYLKRDRNLLMAEDDSYLFYSRFGEVLTVPSVIRKVKGKFIARIPYKPL